MSRAQDKLGGRDALYGARGLQRKSSLHKCVGFFAF
nr:MAG TPA: hypothetical protein [Caudoviricetes sp.]